MLWPERPDAEGARSGKQLRLSLGGEAAEYEPRCCTRAAVQAWLMQNRVAGIASSRASAMGWLHRSHSP
jgi:hypothetical protein